MELLYSSIDNDKNIYHCVFNKSHTMPHKTLAMHLAKCPDRPPNYKNCQFNNLHIVPASELETHLENCPDRYLLDHELYESSDFTRPVVNIIKPTSHKYDKEDEFWNDTNQVATTNVIKNINQNPKLMKPVQGLTRKGRKKYRSEINAQYSNVDLSYNKHTDVQTRTGLNNILKDDQKNKSQLFYGNKP